MKTSEKKLDYIKQWNNENRERKNQNNKAYYHRHKEELKIMYQNKKFFKELPLLDSY